jgi:hypothetical protein
LSSVVPSPDPRNEDAELRSILESGRFRGDGFRKIDRAAYTSTLAPASRIDIYVSAAAAAGYEWVEPDRDGPAPPIPVGTVIVREVIGDKLTAMEKRDPNSFPGGGDFLYAVTDLTGQPIAKSDGSAEWGSLDECGSCHASRKDSSWLFGVMPADR